MSLCSLRWGLLLLWFPVAALADDAVLRVSAVPTAPTLAPGHVAATEAGQERAVSRVWLHAPRSHIDWYALRLGDDWRQATRPLLVIRGSTRAHVTGYLPPD